MCDMKTEFRKATEEDELSVLHLYKSAVGTEFCVWNEFYPTKEEFDADLASGGLFVLTEGGTVIGAVSIVPNNELDGLKCWSRTENTVEIARVVIDNEHRGHRLAAEMVQSVLDEILSRGFASVHLSVSDRNIPAYKTYRKLGFETVGEADMYEGHYFLCEKVLSDQ